MNGMTVIFDTDAGYAKKLTEALIRQGSSPEKTLYFDSEEALSLYSSENPVDTLILPKNSGDFAESIQAERKIYLSEVRGYTSIRGVPTVFKYQPARQLTEEILKAAAAGRSSGEKPLTGLSARSLLSVVSPVGRSGKTSFAFTLGQLLSADSKVLYLNLEPIGGFEGFLSECKARTLSEVMYTYETDPEMLKDRNGFSALTGNFHGMEYLLPVSVPGDISRAEPRRLAEFIEAVSEAGAYDIILLEPGQDYRFLDVFLPMSRKIYLMTRTDPVSNAKLETFRQYLKAFPDEDLNGRTEEVLLPMTLPFAGGRDYAENLLFGEVGDLTRKLLYGMY